MATNNAALKNGHTDSESFSQYNDYLSILLAGQLFGVPVLQVQDVLGEQKVTPIPLSPPEVAGALNLRGRIVTTIDLRKRLGLAPRDKGAKQMSVVVEHGHELYSLIIDEVGDVLSLDCHDYETPPATLDDIWKDVSTGVYRLDHALLLVLDVPKLLDISKI